MVTAAPTAKGPFPPDPLSVSEAEACSAVDRLKPWTSFSSVSAALSPEGAAASSMELDNAGASSVSSPSSEVWLSSEPEELKLPLCREDPAVPVPVFPLPVSVLPLPDPPALPELPPDVLLPEAEVTIAAFISVLFPAV